MIDDFKQFLKVYRAYKKGKKEMEKIKQFVTDHKKELKLAVCGLIIFKLGYESGWKAYRKVTNNVFNTMQRHGYNTVHLVEPKGVAK